MASELERDPLEHLADAFMERYRRGEHPSIDEYAQQHPALAEQILHLFPTLLLMEDLGPELTEFSSQSASLAEAGAKTHPDRLGDFRILRQIGRGGMGVVYEAEEESLGRHVALKILSVHPLADPDHLQRFIREPRAAAKLHHTNIVPVYGVGEHQGVYYYVMQYICGQGLDTVLAEIRQMRQAGSERLVSPGRLSDGSSAVLPGQPDLSSASHADTQYWKSVTRIGLQIASALEHAHGQGIVHRDIKPSNLLLDNAGIVWITDFGLAKATDDADLTQAGDIVGTLRYMAPERFRGHSDARSDIYGVGLVLYELLTLEPVHARCGTHDIVKQMATGESLRPRRINPQIPRDLEIIVLKAMAPDPALRYQTASELGRDLQSFLENRPICARPIRWPERLWRWCRRNPILATLCSAVLSLLLAIALVSLLSSWRLQERHAAVLHHLDRAVKAEGDSQGAERRERTAHRQAMHSLFDAYLAQAQASRWSGREGQRYRSLEALGKAAKLVDPLGLGEGERLALRNEAIASMALVDLRLDDIQWPDYPPASAHIRVAFDQELKRYARLEPEQTIAVRRFADNALLRELPGIGSLNDNRPYLKFSPDGRYLAMKGGLKNAGQAQITVTLWSLEDGEQVLQQPAGGAWHDTGLDFSPDGQWLAVSAPDGSVNLYGLDSEKQQRVSPGPPPYCVRFSSNGRKLAVARGDVVELVQLPEGETTSTFHHPDRVSSVAWSPDGRLLACACGDRRVYLWNAHAGTQQRVFEGHRYQVTHVAFSHNGRLLASTGWDHTSRIWDVESGRELVRSKEYAVQFSSDDRWLALGLAGSLVSRWEVVGGAELRSLHAHQEQSTITDLSFSPDGRMLVSASHPDGVYLWDVASKGRVAQLTDLPISRVGFLGDGRQLMTAGRAGLHGWTIQAAQDGRSLKIGPPQEYIDQLHYDWIDLAISRASRAILVVLDPRRAMLLRGNSLVDQMQLNHAAVRSVALSPEGQWAATAPWNHTSGVQIWNLQSGKEPDPIATFSVGRSARVEFSPDGRWLMINSMDRFQWVAVPSWRKQHEIMKPQAHLGTMQFSDDGNVLALLLTPQQVCLVRPGTGEEMATISSPDFEVISALALNQDASQLAIGGSNGELQLWDLGLVRRRLRQMGLDWDSEPAVASQAPSAAGPLAVEVLGAIRPDPTSSSTHEQTKEAVSPQDKRLQEAIRDLRTALSQNRLEEAAAKADRLVQLYPDRNDGYFWRARTNMARGQDQPAMEDFRRSLAIKPDDVWPCRHLAWLYLMGFPGLQDAREAVELAERATRLEPEIGVCWTTLGAAYYHLERFTEADAAFQRAQDCPSDADTVLLNLLYLAMTQHQLGHFAQADEFYAKADQMQQVHPAVMSNLHRQKDLDSLRAEAIVLLGH